MRYILLLILLGFSSTASASLTIGSINYDSTVVKEESITVTSSVTASSVSSLTVSVTLIDNSGLFTIPTPTQQLQFTTDGTKYISWTITAISTGSNTAPFTVSASGGDGSSASKTSSSVVSVQDLPVLTVTLSKDKSSVSSGDSVTLNYIVSNSTSVGAADATNVVISLAYPSGWSLISGTSSYSFATISPRASRSGSWVLRADNPAEVNTFTLKVNSTLPGGVISKTTLVTGQSSSTTIGGGGGGASGESYDNIEIKEKYDIKIRPPHTDLPRRTIPYCLLNRQC